MPVNHALAICGPNAAAAIAAVENQGIVNVRDFADLSDKDVISVCKAVTD